ncbi:hypothetical protein GVAV_001162 [Gurleya vavrai]
MKKIAVILGGGGHSTEMHLYLKSLNAKDLIYIAEKNDTFANTKFRLVRPTKINKKISIFKILKSIFSALKLIFILKKINFLICNGPGVCIFYSFFLKLFFRTKIIYIESLARKYTLSSTGKIMEYFADVFVVQSKELEMKKRIYYNFFFE